MRAGSVEPTKQQTASRPEIVLLPLLQSQIAAIAASQRCSCSVGFGRSPFALPTELQCCADRNRICNCMNTTFPYIDSERWQKGGAGTPTATNRHSLYNFETLFRCFVVSFSSFLSIQSEIRSFEVWIIMLREMDILLTHTLRRRMNAKQGSKQVLNEVPKF